MKREIAQKWVDAIRSGTYTPIAERYDKIKHQNTFSILGILCDLHRINVGGEWVESYYVPEGYTRGEKIWLHEEVLKWSGCRHKLVVCSGIGILGVMECRDYEQPELADLIEEHWEKL